MSSTSGTSSSYNSPMRMTGLASGLDVDSIVSKLMQAYEVKRDTMKQDETYLEWKRDAYRTVTTSSATLSSTYFDQLNQDTYMLTPNAYADYTGISDDNTNTTADTSKDTGVSASGHEGAAEGKYTVVVNRVGTVAKNATTLTGKTVTDSNGKTYNLGASGSAVAANGGKDTLTVVFNGKTQDFKLGNMSVNDTLKSVASYFNLNITSSNLDGQYHISANNSTGGKIFQTGTTGKITPGAAVDTSAPADVVVGVGGVTGGTGSLGAVDYSAGQNFFTNIFGAGSVNSAASVTATNANSVSTTLNNVTGISMVDGVNANVTIIEPNGSKGTVETMNNDFIMDGVEYDVSKIQLSQSGSTYTPHTANIQMTLNVDKIYKKVTDFIDKYNTYVQQINDKINETKTYSYKPLTDAQKKAMTTDEITKWETQAKQGIVANDSYLGNMITDLRKAFYTPVDGSGFTLTDLGIHSYSGVGDAVNKAGQMQYKPDELKTAIKKYGSSIYNLFAQKSTDEPSYIKNNDINQSSQQIAATMARRETRYSQEGIFQRINDVLQDYTRVSDVPPGTLVQLAGSATGTDTTSTLTKQIKDKLQAITDYDDTLAEKQEEYYKQYSQLETYLAQAQSQQQTLQSQLSKL
ncbi:flagellar filament capping protein FliD [Clostridium felsineum]|uniref:flagellar filament capping protein FliD n=1 Tax=Clostridium felsineum TaxID=36839 RepID=UPI00214D9E5A|nr:flagellar filament capping protein FliD [Clostridium felsineum]MCR3757775.1 flagellar filament capping protein FliD [Clostridium felsineum]